MARQKRLGAALRRLRRGAAEPAAPPADGEPVALGGLEASRREGIATRLRSLRERTPRPGPPLPPPGGAPRSPGGGRGRLAALIDSARLRAADAADAAAVRWQALPPIARQRIAAAVIVALLVGVVVWVLIPAAPCGAPGGDACPAEDDAVALVPADALAYAHVDIDADGEPLAAAGAYADRLPLFSGLLLGAASEVAGERVDFNTQISPWAGDEVAVAVLPSAAGIRAVTMIEAADAEAARRFADGLIGPTTVERAGGLSLALGKHGAAAALLDDFLLIGDEAGVRAMVAGGDAGNLESAAAAAGIDDLPDDRFAYVYLSGDGARSLFARGGALAGLDPLINSRASSAVTAALSFAGGRASLTIRSAQDPELAAAHPDPFAALPRFAPTLDADVGPDALAYLGLGDLAAAESLPARVRGDLPTLDGAVDPIDEDLGAAAPAIAADLLPLLDGEAAFAVEPVAGEGPAPAPGVLAPAGVPYLSLIADGVDGAAVADELDHLRGPLARALASGDVAFKPLQIAGVEAQSLQLSPSVELTYATYDDRLVVATKPVGIAQARAGGDGLADSEDYLAVTATMPAEVSMVAYLDLRDLLSLGEQVGLAEDPVYARLAPDLRMLGAAALSVDGSAAELRTDISVALAATPAPAADAAAGGGD